jgi:predicted HicB family RNase H-like nuclease
MEYKGYIAEFFFDETLVLFLGKISNIESLFTFQGKSLDALRFAFHGAVEDYLAWCKKIGQDPQSPN